MKYVTVEVNRFFTVRKDGRDTNLVAILDFRVCQSAIGLFLGVPLGQVQPQHGAALMGQNPLYFDMAQGPGSKYASRKFKDFCEPVLSLQLVDCGTTYHPFYDDCWPEGRDLHRIP